MAGHLLRSAQLCILNQILPKMSPKHPAKLQEDLGTGFSNRVADQSSRLINADGTFNVRRTGIAPSEQFSIYHELLVMPWWKFHLTIFILFIAINAVFALAYAFIGMDQFAGHTSTDSWGHFEEAFFFSTQTMTTVGYGRVSPIGTAASLVAALEGLSGLMAFAVATGLLYGRFARPKAKIRYSQKALIAPYRSGSGFMFRIANLRRTVISDLTAEVFLSLVERDADGKAVRKFYELPLERKTINCLSLAWTIVHPIDESSPFWGYTQQTFDKTAAEIIIKLNGYDDTFNQNISSRSSYKFHELEWGARFTPTFARSENGEDTLLELDKVGNYERAQLTSIM